MYIYGNISLSCSCNEQYFRQKLQTKSNTRFTFKTFFFLRKSYRTCDNMGKCCIVGQAIDDIIRRMRFACWVTKPTDKHSEYVILIACPRQQWFYERASTLPLHVHCLPFCYQFQHCTCSPDTSKFPTSPSPQRFHD
jgi:hypothetical protein